MEDFNFVFGEEDNNEGLLESAKSEQEDTEDMGNNEAWINELHHPSNQGKFDTELAIQALTREEHESTFDTMISGYRGADKSGLKELAKSVDLLEISRENNTLDNSDDEDLFADYDLESGNKKKVSKNKSEAPKEKREKIDDGVAEPIMLFEDEVKEKTKKGKKLSAEEEYYNSEENDGMLGDTILSDILSGVNGGAFDYEFGEISEEDLQDGSEIGFKGTVINRSHKVTSLRKSGAIGVRAETEASKRLRESYIVGYNDAGQPLYNFNEGGQILDLDMLSTSEVVIKKETSHMGTLYFKECTKEEARDMIICGHYSHKFQGYFGKVNVGVYTEGRLVGVASFGGLMNPKSFKNFGDFKENEVIELNRLWVDDELGMNTETMLLSASWKIMRLKYPEIKIVQSFADGRLGAGTIYKASNFKYFGCESTLFFQDKETGVIYHKVGIENTKAPTSFMRLNKLFCEGRLQQFRVNTYRYIFPLYDTIEKVVKNKDGSVVQVMAKRAKKDVFGNVIKENGKPVLEEYLTEKVEKVPLKISFTEQPFPEYQRGQNMLEDYEHPIKLMTRAYILARLLNYSEDGVDYAKFFENYMNNNDKHKDKELKHREWYNVVKLGLGNETIREMRKVAEENSEKQDGTLIADRHKELEVEFNSVDPRNLIKKKDDVKSRLDMF